MDERTPFSKVSDLRNWVGMSENGIKLYEKKGIIQPDRNTQSGYRRLNISDGDKMFRGRILASYGFTIQEAADILTSSDFSSQYDLLGEKEDAINAEIVEMSLRLQYIRDVRQTMREMKRNINACALVQPSRFYFLPVHDQYQNKAGGVNECGQWLAHVPYVTSAVIADVDSLDGYGTYWYGPIIPELHAYRFHLPLENAMCVGDKSPHYVRGFCRYPLDRNILKGDCEHIFDFIEKLGRRSFGSLIAKHIPLENTEDGMMTYDEVLIPVK